MFISGGQLFWIISMFDLGMAAFLMVSPTIERVQNDAWISLLISGLVSMLATWIGIRLSRYYPEKTFVEYVVDIAGTWIGKTIGFLYVMNWIVVTGMVIRQITDIFITSQFHRTPSWIFICSISLVAVYLLQKNGLQSLGRCTEVIGPLVVFIAVLTFAFDLPNVDWKRLLPVYVNTGPYALLYGAIPATSFLSQTSYVTMLFRFVQNPERNARQAVWGTGIASFFIVISGLFTVATFGADLSKKMWNPIFNMAQYISVGEIIQNIDALIIIIWFFTAFVRVSLFMFLSVYGTAKVLGTTNWKLVTAWVAGISVVIAMIPRNIVESTIVYPEKIVVPFVLPVLVFGIPLLLWFTAYLRARFGVGKTHA